MRQMLMMVFVLITTPALVLSAPVDPSRRAHDVMFRTSERERALFEGFETSVPPPGWTSVVNNAHTWGQSSYNPYEGAYYASCLYDDSADPDPQNEAICVDYTLQAGDECLCFYAMASTYWAIDPYQNYNMMITIDGAEVWNYYDDNDGAVTWQWQRYCVDLSSYTVGQTISICLVYEGYDGAEGAFDALSIGEWPPPQPDPCCPSDNVCTALNFEATGYDGTPTACGAGSLPWYWGTLYNAPAVNCDGQAFSKQWGTSQQSNYPPSTGGALVFGPFDITAECSCLEICHYYQTESGYDGGTVKVSTDGGSTWELVYPYGGYDDVLDSSTYIAECVGGEPVFTGNSHVHVRDCFDLSDYVGQQVKIGFFFGSDISTQLRGWCIAWLKLGSDMSPVQRSSWGVIKAMYR